MKKTIIKGAIVILVFFTALFVISGIMNKGNTDMTAEMADATLPVISVNYGGHEINKMFGYREAMETSQMRESITPLASGRKINLVINPYQNRINEIAYELRSVDGSRLIENTEIREFEQAEDKIEVSFGLKDLIESNREYLLVVVLTLENGEEIRYYTRVIYPEEYYVIDKLDYIVDFSTRTFDKEAAKELTKYLESNSEGDNTNFGRVTIHSSFNQVTWGDLEVTRESRPEITIKDIGPQTGNFVMQYYVSMPYGGEIHYYRVKEYYRVRYTADRMYLLDYERTMDQVFDQKGDAYANNKIMLGITSEETEIVESDGGNVIAFITGNRLFSYNVADNKLAFLFGFYDGNHSDERALYDGHRIKILNLDEGGNVTFLVFGYMNRGRHEGQVGISVFFYDSTVNTVEELVYIPCEQAQELLIEEVDQLSYINKNGMLYLKWKNQFYAINVINRSCEVIVKNLDEESYKVSESNKMVVWQKDGNGYGSRELVLMNLTTGNRKSIQAEVNEVIAPIGFMGEDLIYGIARKSDIVEDYAGNTIFPMYCVRIENETEGILMEYQQEDIYISSGEVTGNQIILKRLKKEGDTYKETLDDQIMNAESVENNKNAVEIAAVDKYEKLTQISLKNNIDAATIKYLTPKEVLFEGGRSITLTDAEGRLENYYVYGKYGIEACYTDVGTAVKTADRISGVVVGEDGGYIWRKGNRKLRNQIMAIQGEELGEERSSLAVCLDTLMAYEGVVRNSEYMLEKGDSVLTILEEGLEGAQILDLTGCSLDAVLYYVDREIPVLVMMQDGGAVLLIGFNEKNTVVMNPESGTVYKVGMNDSTEWFEKNGNHFITYIRSQE